MVKDQQLFSNASRYRIASNDLQRMMNALVSGGNVSNDQAERLLAYTPSITVLRALSAECMLKAIACARSGSFEREHDLSRLYAALGDGIKLCIETVADSYGVASPEKILDRHRTDFMDWRYPAEGEKSTTFLDLDKVLEVLADVYRRIEAGNT